MEAASDAWVYLDAVNAMTADREDLGRVRPLGDYLSQHPGCEEDVARAWFDLRRVSTGSSIDTERSQVGPYRLLRELGRGGQGVVWLAEDDRVGRQVALKILTGLGPISEHALERLRREAAAASRVEHEGICTVYGAAFDEDVPWIAMRYVEGATLARHLDRARADQDGQPLRASDESTVAGPRSEMEGEAVPELPGAGAAVHAGIKDQRGVLVLIEQLARALHVAHEAGVLHRDVKPGNIMVTPGGMGVLLDFGLARLAEEQGPLTQPGEILGTPAYMSPEQVTGEGTIDRRTDVWSLGVVLYECLTLRRPFHAPTRAALCHAILSDDPSEVRGRGVSRELGAILSTALEKDRQLRYRTARAFADDLRALREGRAVSVRPLSWPQRVVRSARRHPTLATLVFLLVVALAALCGVGGYLLANLQVIETGEMTAREQRIDAALAEGFLQLGHGHHAAAFAHFDAALEEGGVRAETVGGLVLSHLAAGEPRHALGVLDAHPDLLDAHIALRQLRFDVRRRLGEGGDDSAPEGRPRTPLDHFLAATRLMQGGHEAEDRDAFARALSHLRTALQFSPKPRALYVMEAVHAAAHCPGSPDAEELATYLVSQWSKSPAAWYWAGFASLFSDPERAIREFTVSLGERPGFASALHHRGVAFTFLERFDEAEADYLEAIRADPRLHHAWRQLGEVRLQTGRVEEAVEPLKQALALNPGNPYTHVLLASAHLGRGAAAEAREAAAFVIEHGLPTPAKLSNLALDFHEADQRDTAVALWRRAVQDFPNHAESSHNLGTVLEYEAPAEAAALLERSLEARPGYAASLATLGRVRRRLGLSASAVVALRDAAQSAPGDASVFGHLAAALRDSGEFAASLVAWKKCRDLRGMPPDPPHDPVGFEEEAERLASLESRLYAVLVAGWEGEPPEQLVLLADIAMRKGMASSASRLYQDAFIGCPALMDEGAPTHRFRAGLAAARVARGWDDYAAHLSAESRADWNRLALSWLHAELDRVVRDEAEGRRARRAAHRLRSWSDTEALGDDWTLDWADNETTQAWRGLRERHASIVEALE